MSDIETELHIVSMGLAGAGIIGGVANPPVGMVLAGLALAVEGFAVLSRIAKSGAEHQADAKPANPGKNHSALFTKHSAVSALREAEQTLNVGIETSPVSLLAAPAA